MCKSLTRMFVSEIFTKYVLLSNWWSSKTYVELLTNMDITFLYAMDNGEENNKQFVNLVTFFINIDSPNLFLNIAGNPQYPVRTHKTNNFYIRILSSKDVSYCIAHFMVAFVFIFHTKYYIVKINLENSFYSNVSSLNCLVS